VYSVQPAVSNTVVKHQSVAHGVPGNVSKKWPHSWKVRWNGLQLSHFGLQMSPGEQVVSFPEYVPPCWAQHTAVNSKQVPLEKKQHRPFGPQEPLQQVWPLGQHWSLQQSLGLQHCPPHSV
jgi:hypothetical protein